MDTTPDPDATLAQWMAEESAVRARHAAAGPPTPLSVEVLAGMTGEEVFDAMLAGRLPAAPIAHTLDFCLIQAGHG